MAKAPQLAQTKAARAAKAQMIAERKAWAQARRQARRLMARANTAGQTQLRTIASDLQRGIRHSATRARQLRTPTKTHRPFAGISRALGSLKDGGPSLGQIFGSIRGPRRPSGADESAAKREDSSQERMLKVLELVLEELRRMNSNQPSSQTGGSKSPLPTRNGGVSNTSIGSLAKAAASALAGS